MQSFIGRTSELAALRDRCDRPGFQMAVVYGRRRVGKTTLINRFIDDCGCKAVSFVALQRGEKEQLALMGNAVLGALAPQMLDSVSFETFERLFTFVAQAAQSERVILLIDEYPYLAAACPYMNSLIQRFVDHEWKGTQLYLILCGSLVSFMRDDVVGECAPLHGRSTLELKLHPMGYRDSGEFVPGYTHEEKAIVYGLTGGVPKYLEQFDDAKSLDQNIVEQFYSGTGYFTEEQIQSLVTADRANPAAFNSVLMAIASGHTKYSEIATCTGMNDIAYYMRTLVALELVEKRSSGGRPYYVIADPMVAFWFKYVSPAASLINAGRGELYYERRVRGRLHEHMGPVFEAMARQWCFENMGTERFPFFATGIEEYQASVKVPGEQPRQVELNLVGRDGKGIAFVGECKFRGEAFGSAELRKLTDKVALLPARDPGIVVFSLGGFSDEVRASGATLVGIEEMYEGGARGSLADFAPTSQDPTRLDAEKSAFRKAMVIKHADAS